MLSHYLNILVGAFPLFFNQSINILFITLERANGQIKSTGTWWVLISKCNGYLEETELRKADRTVGVNCNIFSNISSGTA